MDYRHIGNLSWRFEFKPQDLWVGVFWKHDWPGGFIVETRDVWICLIPMIPLHINWSRTAA